MRINRDVSIARYANVYINGAKHDRVFEADTTAGWAIVVARQELQPPGVLTPIGDELLEVDGVPAEKVYGDVRVTFTFSDLDDAEVTLVEERSA